MARTGRTLLFYALALVGLYYMTGALYTFVTDLYYGSGSYAPETSYHHSSNLHRSYERLSNGCYDLWSECTRMWPDWLERMGLDPNIWRDGCAHMRRMCELDMRYDTAMPSYGYGPGHRMMGQDYM